MRTFQMKKRCFILKFHMELIDFFLISKMIISLKFPVSPPYSHDIYQPVSLAAITSASPPATRDKLWFSGTNPGYHVSHLLKESAPVRVTYTPSNLPHSLGSLPSAKHIISFPLKDLSWLHNSPQPLLHFPGSFYKQPLRIAAYILF